MEITTESHQVQIAVAALSACQEFLDSETLTPLKTAEAIQRTAAALNDYRSQLGLAFELVGCQAVHFGLSENFKMFFEDKWEVKHGKLFIEENQPALRLASQIRKRFSPDCDGAWMNEVLLMWNSEDWEVISTALYELASIAEKWDAFDSEYDQRIHNVSRSIDSIRKYISEKEYHDSEARV